MTLKSSSVITALVLVLAAWMLLAGCTSRGAMRPPPGDLFSRHRYRPPIPAFLKERTASNTAPHTAGVEGRRAMAGPSTGFAPVQEGTTKASYSATSASPSGAMRTSSGSES